ncbi:RNA polymerase subunit sigma-24, partial [Streptomyces sp. ZG43]
RPVVGADKVARLLVAGVGRVPGIGADSLRPAQVNGHPALVLRLGGELDTVVALRLDEGLVTGIYAVRNPEKLTGMARAAALSR